MKHDSCDQIHSPDHPKHTSLNSPVPVAFTPLKYQTWTQLCGERFKRCKLEELSACSCECRLRIRRSRIAMTVGNAWERNRTCFVGGKNAIGPSLFDPNGGRLWAGVCGRGQTASSECVTLPCEPASASAGKPAMAAWLRVSVPCFSLHIALMRKTHIDQSKTRWIYSLSQGSKRSCHFSPCSYWYAVAVPQ